MEKMSKTLIILMVVSLAVLVSCGGNSASKGELLDKPKDGTELVRVDFSKVIAVTKPESIRGVNLNNAMMVVKIKDKAMKMKIPTITYPAGNQGDERDCNTDADLNFFSMQQAMVGTPFTFVQTRVFGGTPELAIWSMERAISNGVRVDVWSIGNEPDLFARNHAPEWTSTHYNEVFRDMVTKMRAHNPNIKIAGPMVSQPKDDWIKAFITANGDLFDVLAWHWYPTDGSASDERALSTATDIRNQIQRYRSWLKDPAINPKGYTKDYKLALTEFALHWATPRFRHLTDMVAGMWTAEVLAYMAMDGMDYSHYFCFGAFGGHAIFEDMYYTPRPNYYIFNILANHFGTNWVNAITSDEKIKAFGSTDGDKMKYVLLINQNQGEKKVNVDLSGAAASVTKVKLFTVTTNEKGAKMDVSDLTPADGKVQVVLPAYTVNALEMN